MLEGGKTEVYTLHVLSCMSFCRRCTAMAYVVWLFAEGCFLALTPASFPSTHTSSTIGMEVSILYCVASGLLLVLLHSYIGGRFARYGFRLITFIHQVVLIDLSLWRMAYYGATDVNAWFGARLFLLCCCVIAEMGPFIVEIGDVLTKIEEDIYSDEDLDWMMFFKHFSHVR